MDFFSEYRNAPAGGISGLIRRALLLLGALGLVSCAEPLPDQLANQTQAGRGFSTYVRYLPLARNGDPKYQNLIGFMSFFGEGAPLDRDQAHLWFHMAAEQGFPLAERNLAIMHKFGLGAPDDGPEAERHARGAGNGTPAGPARDVAPMQRSRTERPVERTYAAFCAGCHGLNGIAAFINSPSFALGERMDKPDAALIGSIRNGVGDMPGWGNKLPAPRLEELLEFVRGFERQYEAGIGQSLRNVPELYFLFGPMVEDDSAYRVPGQ